MSDSAVVSQNPYPVDPVGYLIGSYLACILYGIHISQIYRYFKLYKSDSFKFRSMILWIFTLSTLQILIIITSAWKYFVGGISDPEVWGTFWWPLSFQDGLVPLMAFTAQLYFGRRAYRLWDRRRWFGALMIVLPVITLLSGIALAITAKLWAQDPFVTRESFDSRTIGIPSQVVAILWMGLSALTDGIVTSVLITCFLRARSTAAFSETNSLVWKLIRLTMETVLLTHLVGAVMCILFLTAPARHRTKSTAFWILLEVITELYALSLLFTINSRHSNRKAFEGTRIQPGINQAAMPPEPESEAKGSSGKEELGEVTAWLDRTVEGPRGGPPLLMQMPHLTYTSDGSGQSHYSLSTIPTSPRRDSDRTRNTASSQSSENRMRMEVEYDRSLRGERVSSEAVSFAEFLQVPEEQVVRGRTEKDRLSLMRDALRRESSGRSSNV